MSEIESTELSTRLPTTTNFDRDNGARRIRLITEGEEITGSQGLFVYDTGAELSGGCNVSEFKRPSNRIEIAMRPRAKILLNARTHGVELNALSTVPPRLRCTMRRWNGLHKNEVVPEFATAVLQPFA
jgi:hypothetical protein